MFYEDEYDCHRWDETGYPGEFVYGDNVYVPDEYMDERWLPVREFPGYWISDHLRLWSSHSNRFVEGTQTPKGYIIHTFKKNGKLVRRSLHRLYAEAFVENYYGYPVVRHLNDYGYDNAPENLRWGTYRDNYLDAVRNGTFHHLTDSDRKKAIDSVRVPIVSINLQNGYTKHWRSIEDAGRALNISSRLIQSVVAGKHHNTYGYFFMREDEYDCDFDYTSHYHVIMRPLILATNVKSGEKYIFKGLTKASNELNVSKAGISSVLHGKYPTAKGWHFEYIDEEECSCDY